MPVRRHRWTVDQIEEGIAGVLDEEERLLHLPLWSLPSGTREGDVLRVEQEEDREHSIRLCIRIDPAATEAALRRSMQQVQLPPQPHDPGGDIQL